MKKRSKNLEIFTLSFLDVISCGFGAVVLLVLLSKSTVIGGIIQTDRLSDLLRTLIQVETVNSTLESQSQNLSQKMTEQTSREIELQKAIEKAQQTLAEIQSKNASLDKELAAFQKILKLPSATISADTDVKEEIYAGGIPVDANYVVFIVDTSGSMQQIWGRVMARMENILSIHPKIKGFQIINDNGIHLISSYKGRWISDTPSLRKRVLKLLHTWQAFSNSSPVEGLQVALYLYVKPGMKVSIYILGDDYTGASYDPVFQTIAKMNTNKISGDPIARIHGIGFYNKDGGDITRLSTLLREVARQSHGTFIALN